MNVKPSPVKFLRVSAIFLSLLILFTTTTAQAASVTFRWDPSDPAPEGYRVFARKSDQVYNYNDPAWEGNAVTCTIDHLDDQTEYYFVARAFDGSQESGDSNEVHYIPPAPIPPPPDTTPPAWNGATTGIGLAADNATGGSVTLEFDTASDGVDGTNLRFNVYFAPSGSWNHADWTANSVVADAAASAGSAFAHAVTVSGLRNEVSYTFGTRVEDQSGNEDANTGTLTAVPTASESSAPYQQDAGVDGVVSIEVENFDASVSQGGHDWVAVYPPGFSGAAAMQAQPDIGTNNDSGYVSTSPRLDFAVNFVHTGIHYVWVRGLGADNGADSVHVGLDGKQSATSDRMSSFSPNWTWSNQTKDRAVARVYVATTGVHTVNVWMREDGFVFDKLALTVNAGTRPLGEWLAESPRGNSMAFNPDTLAFTVEAGETGSSQVINLGTSDNSSGVGYTVSDDAAWLSVTPTSGVTPDDLTVSIDATGLTAGTYTATITAKNDGYADDSVEVTLTVTGNNALFQQDPGADGVVSIEGEDFDLNASQGGRDWVTVYPAGSSGSAAMKALPDAGALHDTGYVSTSPRLDYAVNFVHTGIHYVWVRGMGADKGADSVHVGLDGKQSATSDRMSSFSPSWTWSNQTKDLAVARVNVAAAGVHTVNVWMREDGFVLDKLVLTVSPGYLPIGAQP
jgi:hypothetical protein